MDRVKVVTDSVASLPDEFLHRLDIHCVAYYIHRGQEVLRDLVTIQRDEFYSWLSTAKDLPTTACPGPGDYLQTYERLVQEDDAREIISIHMTAKGSGAYQAALEAQAIAMEHHPGLEIEVIDTQNASLAHGWIVVEAARAALRGDRLAQVVARVRRMIPVTHMIHTADTLRYLYMGGRIGKAKHLAGSVLSIKPLIGMEEGVIVALGVARSRAQAYAKMVGMIEEAAGRLGKVKIAYVHAAAQEEAEKIKLLIESRLDVIESFVAELSPALGVHSGPGTAGVCFFLGEDSA